MIAKSKILEYVREYAERVMTKKVHKNYCYHNLQHTKDVVRAVKEVGMECNLSEDEMEIVTIAAWLHDIGYEHGFDDHEEVAKDKARKLLLDYGYNKDKIEKVIGCIHATRIPQKPTNILEKVICDADLYHLSSDRFDSRSELLRIELCSTREKKISADEWKIKTINFMEKHSYFTNYGIKVLEKRKRENIKRLAKELSYQ